MKSITKQFLTTGLVLGFAVVSLQNCKKADVQPESTAASEAELTSAAKKRADGVDMTLVASGFTSPLGVVPFPDQTGRLAVIDQSGQIWVLEANGTKMPAPFIDVSS